MKKALVIIALSISIVACNKPAEVKEVKTAYIDTSELMKEYTEAKDLEAKYKTKAEEKGRQLEAEINRFKQEAAGFQAQAQANGQAWAQQKGAELQKKEQQLAESKVLLLQNEAKTRRTNYVLIALSIVVFFVALVGYLLYRQQKAKVEQKEKEFELKSAIALIESGGIE